MQKSEIQQIHVSSFISQCNDVVFVVRADLASLDGKCRGLPPWMAAGEGRERRARRGVRVWFRRETGLAPGEGLMGAVGAIGTVLASAEVAPPAAPRPDDRA